MLERKIYELEWAGKKLILETGALAPLANAAVKVQYGDTVVLATAVMGEVNPDLDYFPLLVDYKENLYAAGKISGSRFMKREGKPTDEAVLTGRIVDRSIRPLFDLKFKREVQVVLNVFSMDEENDPDVPSLIAASAALTISDIPWNGPIAGASVAVTKEGQLILNPSFAEKAESSIHILAATNGQEIVMLEGAGRQASEEKTAEAIQFALANTKAVVDLIKKMQTEIGKAKQPLAKKELTPEEQAVATKSRQFAASRIQEMFGFKDKIARSQKEEALMKELTEGLEEEQAELAKQIWAEVYAEAFRKLALEKDQRVDQRAFDQIRDLALEVDILPRTHGSALFQRGETQILSIVTLGAPGQEQVLDQMELSGTKRYMHHYNFLGFCVGEVGPLRSPSRREIGHGALAEKAVEPMIPPKEKFPYTIRVVSEVLSSNGSSSQGSICGSTLALMAAGVPIENPVAGIAIGLVTSADGKKWKLLTDIQGIEDHEGDMDFKIAGTTQGITAMQMDIKLGGINMEIVRAALTAGLEARTKILAEMTRVISGPRTELSKYAPRIEILQINPDKIRELIGPGGKVINEIIDATGVNIDIEDDGKVFVTSTDAAAMQEAIKLIQGITKEITIGEIYEGKVTQIIKDRNQPNKEIGAIVQLTPNQDGMVHISAVANERINKVSDVLKVGDVIKVKVMGVDKEKGRVELSRKVLLNKSFAQPETDQNPTKE